MNNPLRNLKKCEFCGTTDSKKHYVIFESANPRKIGKLTIKEKVILCEECASLGAC
jgi:hypothetical protein